jgi:hypothetical protein
LESLVLNGTRLGTAWEDRLSELAESQNHGTAMFDAARNTQLNSWVKPKGINTSCTTRENIT